jgi:hypothetical protein
MKLAALVTAATLALCVSTHAHAGEAGPSSPAEFDKVYHDAVADGVNLGVKPTKTCGTQRCDNVMTYVQGNFSTTVHNFVYSNGVVTKVMCIVGKNDVMHDLCFDSNGYIWGEEYVGGNWQLGATYRKGWNDQLASSDQGTM